MQVAASGHPKTAYGDPGGWPSSSAIGTSRAIIRVRPCEVEVLRLDGKLAYRVCLLCMALRKPKQQTSSANVKGSESRFAI